MRCFLKGLDGNTVQVEVKGGPDGYPKAIYFDGMFFVLEEVVVDHAWYRQVIASPVEEVL